MKNGKWKFNSLLLSERKNDDGDDDFDDDIDKDMEDICIFVFK